MNKTRGRGRLQKAIEATFRQNPGATYSAEELAPVVYPDLDGKVGKKHRVAILRAAEAAAESCGWWRGRADRPGRAVIYGNPLDLHSYAVWSMRRNDGSMTSEKMEQALNDPEVWCTKWDWVQPGGAWWYHVEINKADAAGDTDKGQLLREELNVIVRAKLHALGSTAYSRVQTSGARPNPISRWGGIAAEP